MLTCALPAVPVQPDSASDVTSGLSSDWGYDDMDQPADHGGKQQQQVWLIQQVCGGGISILHMSSAALMCLAASVNPPQYCNHGTPGDGVDCGWLLPLCTQ